MRQWWLLIALVLSLGINAGWILKGLLTSSPPQRETGNRRLEPALDDPPNRRGERRPLAAFVGRLADDMDLQGDQRQDFIDLQIALIERVQEAHAQTRELREDLRFELMAGAPDRARIETLLVATSEVMSDLDRAFVDTVLASRELLDAGQERRYLRFVGRLREMRGSGRRLHGLVGPGDERRPGRFRRRPNSE